jgi:3-methyladenine DNA glycosylase AlkC
MAEPLKNSFGPDVAVSVGTMIFTVEPTFDQARYEALALDGYEDLELTPRAHRIADALAVTLPADRKQAMIIITGSLGPEIEEAELTGMESFRYLPFVFFVAEHGLDHFDTALTTQYELTKRFTAEFSIRAYLDRYPDRTLDRLRLWARDDNVHVRRLVSEGTRPRLPWAPRLRRFQQDPAPVIELLDMLKDDPEEYVRRSVANNLNDISKDHPELAAEIAARWWNDDPNTRRLVRHGMRTLIKAGDPRALAVLGYTADSPVVLNSWSIEPPRVVIGAAVRLTAELDNRSDRTGEALVDFVVHFVKANGRTSPKVFKGGERSLPPGGTSRVTKKISVAQHSTRTHFPGVHRVDVQINGVTYPAGKFEIEAEGRA